MIRWNNDYNRAAHPAVLEALSATSDLSYGGYGMDECCDRAKAAMAKHLGGVNADIHFLTGGTQANFVAITCALRPIQAVISSDCGHIFAHETGAIENTGHKVIALPAEDSKLSARAIEKEAQAYLDSGEAEYLSQPKMVYLSSPSEYGTVYSLAELRDISAVCRKYGLYLFLDGARLAYGLGCEGNDVSLADIAKLCDIFYIGGTKCGAMFGEAMVIVNDELKPYFRSYMKQNGAMLAKGWLLGLQFAALFENDLYLTLGKKACAQAMEIKKALTEAGVEFYNYSPTNQQFFLLTDEQLDALSKKHIFEFIFRAEDGRKCMRCCTGWHTKDEDVQELIKDIKELL